jgi:hypothetical protein
MINVLTPEQITTLEEAFYSYPDNYKKNEDLCTMEGIERQLKDPRKDLTGKHFIAYIDNVKSSLLGCEIYSFSINKMYLS